MGKTALPLYKLEKGDKIIFVLFFLIFSALLLLTEDEPEEPFVEDLYLVAILTGNAVVLVYFTVFKWLKQFDENRYYFFIVVKIILLALFLLGLQNAFFYSFIGSEMNPQEDVTWLDIVGVLIVMLLLSGVLLGVIMLKKGVGTQIQILKTENLHKSYELKALKSQIDPHFLFNNLNTLDALIDTDVKKAKPYIQRLAKLYQYLLATQEEDTVNLKEEMNFAEDYIYLIKERFGDNYQFKIIDERKNKREEKLIPPGAIQTVFENVVKHNNASKHHPVIAEIIIQDEQLVISNNIRSKKDPIVSFGIGLNNLQSRYQILCNRPLGVQLDKRFTIILPLIQKLNGHKHEGDNN